MAVLIGILTFSACTSEAPKTQSNVASEIKVDVKKVKNDLSISIVTNFPDETNLHVTVGRPHYLKGKSELYSGDIFSEDIAVKNGKIECKCAINDKKWFDEHSGLTKASAEDFPPVSKIIDSLHIRVLFSPRRKQTEKVLQYTGKNGENLKGDGVDNTFKSFKSFSVEKSIHAKVNK